MKKLVLDVSVVLKWFLPDDEIGQRALNILLRDLLSDPFMMPRIWPWQRKKISIS
jgi:hypothetical protein